MGSLEELAEDHRHCKVCGKVVAADREVCSKACARTREERAATRRNYSYLLYIAIAILVLVVLLSYVSH